MQIPSPILLFHSVAGEGFLHRAKDYDCRGRAWIDVSERPLAEPGRPPRVATMERVEFAPVSAACSMLVHISRLPAARARAVTAASVAESGIEHRLVAALPLSALPDAGRHRLDDRRLIGS